MEATRYQLFPDGREPAVSFEAMETETKAACEGGLRRSWGRQGGLPPALWTTWTKGVDPHAVITALHRVDWEHAPLLVYRSVTDNSWSYLRIVRRVATLWGDDEERRGDADGQGSAAPGGLARRAAG